MNWYPGQRIVNGLQNVGDRVRENRQNRRDLQNAPTYNQDPTQMPTSPQAQGMAGIMGQGASALNAGQQAQQQSLDAFNAMAAGQGPSLAQQQLAAGTQQNISDQMGLAAMGRGGNLSGQAQQAAAAGAAGQVGLQQQMGQLRAQEQMQAMQQSAAMANQMAGQGLQQQLAGAGMSLDAQGMANQYGLGQRGLDQGQLALLQQQQQANRGFGMGILQMGAQAGASLGGLG